MGPSTSGRSAPTTARAGRGRIRTSSAGSDAVTAAIPDRPWAPAAGKRPKGQPRPGRVAGFTLLELLVVLAIAALLLAVVPPLFTAVVPGVELKGAARRVASGLRLAREEAIRSGRDAAFVIDVDERAFRVDGPYRLTRLPAGLDIKLEAAESEMQGEGVGGVRFFPDGTSTGGRVILARGGSGLQVGVNWLTGRVETAPWEER